MRDLTVTLVTESVKKHLFHDIILFLMVLCDIFLKHTQFSNHIIDWFDFCCCCCLHSVSCN